MPKASSRGVPFGSKCYPPASVPLAESIATRLDQIESIDELRHLSHRALTANSLAELDV